MKKLLLALLAGGIPCAASAQILFVDNNYLQYITRPYRDRAERFKSARADALQMTLAIDDEASRLTLENWGDNRADLNGTGGSVKAGVNGVTGEEFNGAGVKTRDVSGYRLGAHAAYNRVEAEAYGAGQVRETVATGAESENRFAGAGAGAAFGGEALSFGLHGNFNRAGDENWDELSFNHSAGGAAALRTGLWQLGATADYVARGTQDDPSNDDKPLNGPSLGVQAIATPLPGLKAALRGGFASLSGDAQDNGVAYDNYERDDKELGARLEWKLEAVPLTLGLEYARMIMTPESLKTGVHAKSETDLALKTAGAGLRLLGDRLLLAAELQELVWTSEDILPTPDKDENTLRTLTAGAEFWILPSFAARASYRKTVQEGQAGADDTYANTAALGAGFKGEKLYLDLTARRVTQDEDAVEPDTYTDLRLTLGLKF